MKTIILISSIFFILGIKISHNFDVIKRTDPVQKTMVLEKSPCLKPTCANCPNNNSKPATDSLGIDKSGASSNEILESK
jgi:hypothetical protein